MDLGGFLCGFLAGFGVLCCPNGANLAWIGNVLENCCAVSTSSCVHLDLAIKPCSAEMQCRGKWGAVCC